MSRVISVIVIEGDVETRGLIRQTLGETQLVDIIAETDSLIYGYELVRQNHPDVVFIDLRADTAKTLELVTRISTHFKDVLIVISGDQIDLQTIMACMQAGAREFIRRPIQREELLGLLHKHQSHLGAESQGDDSGRIITIFSNKGGLGKTTLAVNLAQALSEVTQQPVALVDLNLQLGDIVTFLDVTPKQTIVDIARNIGRVDAAYLETSLAKFEYGASRVYVLADPLHVEEAEEVTADQINTVLTVLKATFPYVIIDTTTSFDSKTLTALDLADNIMLVSMVNLPCIRSNQRVLSLFERLGYDKQKVKLVMNRYVPDDEISVEDVEETLDHGVYWKIPNNYFAVMTAINRGIPISSLENGQAIYQNFLGLARQVSGLLHRDDAVESEARPAGLGKKPTKSLLSGLFGRR
ncbi:MAG: response regulator [Vampirovibrionales bacterium]|nr:response regulator [Vampirovibrionales bacterium]